MEIEQATTHSGAAEDSGGNEACGVWSKKKKRPEAARKEKRCLKEYKGFTCDICGKKTDFGDDVPSIVTMTANYGSTRHDGDKVTLKVCGECIDWLLDSIPAGAGKWERVVPW